MVPVSIVNGYPAVIPVEECRSETLRMRTERVLEFRDRQKMARAGPFSFQAGSKMMTFNLKNEETVAEILARYGSPALNDEMIRCYLTVVNACEIGSGTWLAQPGRCRSFRDAECSIRGQSKFHIAMLSISLIVGISAVVVLFFCTRYVFRLFSVCFAEL